MAGPETRARGPRQRIVVLAPNWLGDLVMAMPALAALRLWRPDATLTLAARAGLAPLGPLVTGIDETLPLDGRGGLGALATWRKDAARLAAGRFDAAVLLPNSLHAALLAWHAGIPERWGYRADLRTPLLTRAIARPRPRMHQAEYYRALTAALGAPVTPLRAALAIDEPLRVRAREVLTSSGWQGGPLLGLAPGAAFGPAKRWSPERMGRVAAGAARTHGAAPVIVGARHDARTARQVVRAYGEMTGRGGATAPIDLTGRTDLPLLAAVLSLCAAVVSNDSGAMHVAAAAGAPVVGLFGPTDERATSPLPHPSSGGTTVLSGAAFCRPCGLRACPIDHRCMTSLDADRVTDAVNRHLARLRVPGERA